MTTLIIQQGDSARIEIVLPIDKMAQVEDVVCTIGNRLSYSLSKGTLIPTATSNVFHVNIQSVQSQKHTGNLELVVAIDYSDIGVKKTKRAENLVVQVVRNENYFNNNSISDLVSAVVIVTVDEDVVTSIPILASYLVINGGGGGAVNSVNGQTGVVVLDADDITETATRVFVSPSDKTAIAHSNRTILDLITEAFTTSLKNTYDGAVSGLSSLLATGARLITNAEITKLTNTTGTNTGDESTISIQTKRPLKTINGNSMEGSGNVVVSGGGILPIQTMEFDYAVFSAFINSFYSLEIGLGSYFYKLNANPNPTTNINLVLVNDNTYFDQTIQTSMLKKISFNADSIGVFKFNYQLGIYKADDTFGTNAELIYNNTFTADADNFLKAIDNVNITIEGGKFIHLFFRCADNAQQGNTVRNFKLEFYV